MASNSPNCIASTSNVSVSQINTIINTSTAQSNIQKLPSLKSSAPSVSISCSKTGGTVSLGSSPSVVTTEGNAASNNEISMNFVPGGPASNIGAPKVTVSNDIIEPSSNGGPEDNKVTCDVSSFSVIDYSVLFLIFIFSYFYRLIILKAIWTTFFLDLLLAS